MIIFIFEKEIKIKLTIRHGEYMMISYRKTLVKNNCSKRIMYYYYIIFILQSTYFPKR